MSVLGRLSYCVQYRLESISFGSGNNSCKQTSYNAMLGGSYWTFTEKVLYNHLKDHFKKPRANTAKRCQISWDVAVGLSEQYTLSRSSQNISLLPFKIKEMKAGVTDHRCFAQFLKEMLSTGQCFLWKCHKRQLFQKTTKSSPWSGISSTRDHQLPGHQLKLAHHSSFSLRSSYALAKRTITVGILAARILKLPGRWP